MTMMTTNASMDVTTVNTTSMKGNGGKNVDNTVFVRFIPPSNSIRRHHVEELFSQCGPIKKSSIIHNSNNKGEFEGQATNDNKLDATTTTTSSSYGFVKYTSPDDAELASIQLNNRIIKMDGKSITVKVELAKKQVMSVEDHYIKQNKNHHGNNSSKKFDNDYSNKKINDRPLKVDNNNNNQSKEAVSNEQQQQDIKKTNRCIVRNLSFYAKEQDIRSVLESKFGPILDIHIPKVIVPTTNTSSNNNKSSMMIKPTHRGFAFVTFQNNTDVEKCITSTENIQIKERNVQITKALHKTAHAAITSGSTTQQQEKPQSKNSTTLNHTQTETDNKPDKDDKDDDDTPDEEIDEDDESNDSNDDDDDDDDKDEDIDDEEDVDESGMKVDKSSKNGKLEMKKDETAIIEGRCLFVRNLPFDCTRHDLFELFRLYGYITSIFIVKTNKDIPKGTAFVTFQKKESAQKVLQVSKGTTTSNDTVGGTTTDFISQRTATNVISDPVVTATIDAGSTINTLNGNELYLKGRRLFVDLAVDKETASTLAGGILGASDAGNADKIGYKDRRNLYLKNEGRVDNNESKNSMLWDELPENDKLKRQSAWSEKNTKLRSPLFYINPCRLSIRNLAKHIDEAALKKLIVTAIHRGLYVNKLVQAEDQIAHWRALGEYTTRDILAKIQESERNGVDIIPTFDEKNIKQYIPSLHIHRDVVTGGNKNIAPSRGFGFVEFQHHAHALACLRELNNNPFYSKEYAIGGKHVALMKERRNKRSNKKRKIDPSAIIDDLEDGTKLNDENFITADGSIRTPRLIVEFTVENKAKAKQQAEHKAKQQANQLKQRVELKTSVGQQQSSPEKVRKSRGAIQREKKRLRQQQGEEGDDEINHNDKVNDEQDNANVTKNVGDVSESTHTSKEKKVKGVAPPKKAMKLDPEEVNFSKLVASYQQQALGANDTQKTKSSNVEEIVTRPKKRWFE